MAGKPLEKARQVRNVVDAFYRAFIEARNTCLGSPRVERDRTKERHDAGFDTAVIGFWQKDDDIPQIVCSLAGMSMISEICQKRQKLQDTKFSTAKKRKEFNEMWDRFQSDVLRRIPDTAMTRIGDRLIFRENPHIQQVREAMVVLEQRILQCVTQLRGNHELLSPRPGDHVGEQIARDLRGQPQMGRDPQGHEIDAGRPRTFSPSEAEAFMATTLMCDRRAGVIHFYGRWSPCCTCSPSLKWLSYSYGPHAPKNLPPPPDMQWRIGWVFYGEIYEHDRNIQRACANQLDWATRLGGIAGHEMLTG